MHPYSAPNLKGALFQSVFAGWQTIPKCGLKTMYSTPPAPPPPWFSCKFTLPVLPGFTQAFRGRGSWVQGQDGGGGGVPGLCGSGSGCRLGCHTSLPFGLSLFSRLDQLCCVVALGQRSKKVEADRSEQVLTAQTEEGGETHCPPGQGRVPNYSA